MKRATYTDRIRFWKMATRPGNVCKCIATAQSEAGTESFWGNITSIVMILDLIAGPQQVVAVPYIQMLPEIESREVREPYTDVSLRAGSKIIVDSDGYRYSSGYKLQNTGKTCLRCNKKNKGCRAYIVVDDQFILTKVHSHNHWLKKIVINKLQTIMISK